MEGTRDQPISIALDRSAKREYTRERGDVRVVLCFFFAWCIVVVPEGTSPRRRPRSRAIACVRAIRERVRDETILSAERDARVARGALGAPTRVRFFVTRARRDPSTSSRPPRSDARVVSEIRGQIFVFLLFPSIVFDRPRAPLVDEGTPRRLFLIFSSYSYYFPAVARARGLFDRGRGFDTSPASRHLPWGKRRFVTRHLASDANARPRRRVDEKRRRETRKTRLRVSTHTFIERSRVARAQRDHRAIDRPSVNTRAREGEIRRESDDARAGEARVDMADEENLSYNNHRSPFGPRPRAMRMIRPADWRKAQRNSNPSR